MVCFPIYISEGIVNRFECSYTDLINPNDLIPHPGNRNIHSEKQIKALAKIISKNGQRSPIVVSELSGYVVKGHGRLEAIKLLGWNQCAVDKQKYVDEAEEFRDRIADNEIARYSEFDSIGFKSDLIEMDFDLTEIDFEDFGKLDFIIEPMKIDLGDDPPEENENKKYIVEVKLSNEMEQMDLYDDLISKGYLAKVKGK